jgi:hypothetical protein
LIGWNFELQKSTYVAEKHSEEPSNTASFSSSHETNKRSFLTSFLLKKIQN